MHFWRRSLASATGLPWLCRRKPEQVLACVVRQRNVERSPGPEKSHISGAGPGGAVV